MDNFLSERLWAPLLKLVPSEDIGKIVIDIIYWKYYSYQYCSLKVLAFGTIHWQPCGTH